MFYSEKNNILFILYSDLFRFLAPSCLQVLVDVCTSFYFQVYFEFRRLFEFWRRSGITSPYACACYRKFMERMRTSERWINKNFQTTAATDIYF